MQWHNNIFDFYFKFDEYSNKNLTALIVSLLVLMCCDIAQNFPSVWWYSFHSPDQSYINENKICLNKESDNFAIVSFQMLVATVIACFCAVQYLYHFVLLVF